MSSARPEGSSPKFNVFDAERDAVIVTGADWCIRYANDAACNLLCIDRAGLVEAFLNRLPMFREYPALFEQLSGDKSDEVRWEVPGLWTDFAGGQMIHAVVEKLSESFEDDDGILWRLQSRVGHRDTGPLPETAEMYRNLVELASDGICIMQNEIVQYANPQLCEMLSLSSDELVGTPFLDHIDVDDAHKLKDLYYHHLGGARELGVVPIRAVHRDGSSVEVEVDGSIIPYRGKPATIVTLHNVTEQNRTARALREREEQYRLVTENTSDIIWSYDLQKRCFSFVSKAAERILGFTADEYSEMGLADVLPIETARWVARQMEEMIENWPEQTGLFAELEHKRKNGERVWMEVNASLVGDPTKKPTMVAGVSRDVTERHEQARKLIESEERYRQLVSLSPNLIAVIGEDQKVAFINDAGARMLGVATPSEVVGTDVWRFVGAEAEPQMRRRWQEVTEEGVAARFEVFRFHRNDGVMFHMELGSVPFVYGGAKAVLSIGRDVTDRLKAEIALKYRLELLLLINEIAAKFISLEAHEIDAGIEDALETVATFIGVERGYVYLYRDGGQRSCNTHNWVAERVASLTPVQQDFDTNVYRWGHEKFLAGNGFLLRRLSDLPSEARVEREKFEAQKIVAMAVVPIVRQGDVLGFLGFEDLKNERDWDEETISLLRTMGTMFATALERKKAHEALFESERTAEVLVNATGAVAALVEPDWTILLANDEVAMLVGKPAADLVGVNAFDLMPDRWREETRKTGSEVVAGKVAYIEQLRFGAFWYLTSINPILGADGEVKRVAVFGRDITDIKRQEQELREALRSAQEAELLKSRFLANMSHEVRTPLNHIIGLTSVLLLQPDMPDEERNGYLAMIRRGGESMLSLLTAILDLSKIESGRNEPTSVTFNAGKWIDDLRRRYLVEAEGKGLAFSIRANPRVPTHLIADPVMLEQVLNNLVGNAIKFTRHGSVEVQIDGEPRRGDGQWLLSFRVTDTGIGIEPQKLRRIFDAFFQVDDSSTREYRGAGLGLTISRELVKTLGGEVRVVSRPGRGSTFSFTCLARELLE